MCLNCSETDSHLFECRSACQIWRWLLDSADCTQPPVFSACSTCISLTGGCILSTSSLCAPFGQLGTNGYLTIRSHQWLQQLSPQRVSSDSFAGLLFFFLRKDAPLPHEQMNNQVLCVPLPCLCLPCKAFVSFFWVCFSLLMLVFFCGSLALC